MTSFGTFDETVRRFAQDAKQSVDRVRKDSIKEVAAEANKPVEAGGNMHVNTGYLRASQRASTNGPVVPNAMFQPEEGSSYSFNANVVNSVVDKSEWGDTVYIGWTAAYAGFREHTDGFMRLAVQNWHSIVERQAKKRNRSSR